MGFKHNARPAEWVLDLNPIATDDIPCTYTYTLTTTTTTTTANINITQYTN